LQKNERGSYPDRADTWIETHKSKNGKLKEKTKEIVDKIVSIVFSFTLYVIIKYDFDFFIVNIVGGFKVYGRTRAVCV